MTPKVSVVVPVYNTSAYLGQCLDSILLQTFKDFEAVVVDDISTDGSYELVRDKYCNPSSENYDSRVKLFRNETNSGFGGRNADRALKFIQPSEYVYMMSGDDGIVENAIETLVTAADESHADIVSMDGHFVAGEEFQIPGVIQIQRSSPPSHPPRMLSEDLATRMQEELLDFYGVMAVEWAKLFRRDFLIDNKIYHPKVLGIEDFFHNFACLCLAKRFRVIQASLYVYRQNSQSVMHVSAENHVRKTVLGMAEGIRFMEEVFSKNLISPISRENQILLESFTIFYLIHQRITRYGLSPLDLNKVLEEIINQDSTIDPNITRLLIQSMNQILKYVFFHTDNMLTPFDLTR